MASPDIIFEQLFTDVQLSGVFQDSKTFVDCTPKRDPADILSQYKARKAAAGFDLSAFVHEFFEVPEQVASSYNSDTTLSTSEHINQLWDRLTRAADIPVPYSSRVPLPHPYVVPGGRFREIFYWDSYFTMLGLRESGRVDLIRDMIANFAYLIDTVGFIPNGNRTYFLSRSQPPFFALMVQLLAEIDGQQVLVMYLPQLQKEWDFWMTGQDDLSDAHPRIRRVAQQTDGLPLNRYWDDTPVPRPEAYRQEIELNLETEPQGITPETLYNHIRAACESGWDFSSRWFADASTLATIQAADMLPVDLNCLLYSLEYTLADGYALNGDHAHAALFEQLATDRAHQIGKTFWSETSGFFTDLNLINYQLSPILTLAGLFPLFFNLATPEQALQVHNHLKTDFLQAGGWVTTLNQTGQQWDWPNGWAPLQWIVYTGLMNYGFTETAHEGRDRWLALNDKVFKATGKMMEKYNVLDAALTTGGGEYPNQDGFGWTNGVYLALSAERGR